MPKRVTFESFSRDQEAIRFDQYRFAFQYTAYMMRLLGMRRFLMRRQRPCNQVWLSRIKCHHLQVAQRCLLVSPPTKVLAVFRAEHVPVPWQHACGLRPEFGCWSCCTQASCMCRCD